MVKEWFLCNPSQRFLKEIYLSSLSTRNMSLINAEAGAIFTVVVACLALEAIMKDQVEQNQSPSNGNRYQLCSREEPESVRLCAKIGKYGSWHLYICHSVFGILSFCFAEFDTSVTCHAVFMLCLGSFLLQNMFYSLSRKTVNTSREKISGMFIVSQPIITDETAKDNHQTAACISHNLIQNNELAFFQQTFFSSTTILQKPNYRILNRPRSECKLSKFTQYKFSNKGFSATKNYGSKISNHSQLAWPFELHVKRTGQLCFWLVRYFLLSEAPSSLVSSYLPDSTKLSCNMSLNISLIFILCT